MPSLPEPVQTFAFEDKDWGVAAQASPKRPPYHAPTPLSVPGGRVVKTLALNELLQSNKDVIVIDVLDSRERRTIPGALWMVGPGEGLLYASEKEKFSQALETATGGSRTRPLVFLCVSSECWMSYNASLHAIGLGYTDVIWYRGGTDAWRGASLPVTQPKRAY